MINPTINQLINPTINQFTYLSIHPSIINNQSIKLMNWWIDNLINWFMKISSFHGNFPQNIIDTLINWFLTFKQKFPTEHYACSFHGNFPQNIHLDLDNLIPDLSRNFLQNMKFSLSMEISHRTSIKTLINYKQNSN